MMAICAFVLYLVFGLLGFGWRSWRQYQATGSTGFHGISGRPGSLEWLAGVVAPLGVLSAMPIQATGFVLAVAGIAATLYAQLEMGESWRIGVDPTETTTLVDTGVFGLVRNPIFTAMLVFAGGVTLIIPNAVAIVAFALLLVTIEGQVRAVEEPYLTRVHGVNYRAYLAATGRFVPGIGRAPL